MARSKKPFILLTLPLAVGAACLPPTTSSQLFLANHYDYIIVGGGTAGLTLAARLSEDPSRTVGVIEAGVLHFPDPIIDVPGNSQAGLGNNTYDWSFFTVPQPSVNNREIRQSRGRVLGGSSAINGLAWNRASKPEYDAWQMLTGTPHWNFAQLLPFFRKSENFARDIPNSFPDAQNSPSDGSPSMGFSGPINASLNTFYADPVFSYVQTLNRMGIATNTNPQSGDTRGISNTFTSINRKEGVRSYAAPAYYCASSFRKNLHILAGAQATKIVFAPQTSSETSPFLAIGVRFVAKDGTISTVNFTREVIISAGVVKTPQLLELSGIGDKRRLTGLGIAPLIDLPSVGENLQEHIFAGSSFELKSGLLTFDALVNNASFAAEQAAQYNRTKDGLLAATNSALAFLPASDFVTPQMKEELLDIFDTSIKDIGPLTPLQSKQYAIQRQWLIGDRVPQIEVIQLSSSLGNGQPGKSYISLLGGVMHPVARGSIHINTTDPLAPPIIDGRYLNNNFDVHMLLEMLKFTRRAATSDPIKNDIIQEAVPGINVTEDADLINYIRSTASVGSHIIGTAAMASKALGGVVDVNLKVYGTANLRVVDCSVIPLQLGSHIQATVYAMAEKIADILRRS